jgi:haloalkane dehalogenase
LSSFSQLDAGSRTAAPPFLQGRYECPQPATADQRFNGLDWHFSPCYFIHPDGLRQHYIDERPSGDVLGTFLLLHGEPTWAYLYKDWIKPLVSRGYRVVVPDHFGFGRSDKPTQDSWYSIARHRHALERLVADLELDRINLVVQDWGGPIGLCNAMTEQDRYARLFFLNTWLHADAFDYSDGIRWWRQTAFDPINLGDDMPIGRNVNNSMLRPNVARDSLVDAFDAPFPDEASKAGARRFPFCLSFAEPDLGEARLQSSTRAALAAWDIPKHLAFGDHDFIFTWQWAEQWAAELGATLDRIPGAGHFVQVDALSDCLDIIFSRLSEPKS